jgi:hypothetical protein
MAKAATAHPPFRKTIGDTVFYCVWDSSANAYSCEEVGAATAASARANVRAKRIVKSGRRSGARKAAGGDAHPPFKKTIGDTVFYCVWDARTNTYSCEEVGAARAAAPTKRARAKGGARAKTGGRAKATARAKSGARAKRKSAPARKSPRKRR